MHQNIQQDYSTTKIHLKLIFKISDENKRYRLEIILANNCMEIHFGSRIGDDSISLFNSGIGEIFPFSSIFKEFKTSEDQTFSLLQIRRKSTPKVCYN